MSEAPERGKGVSGAADFGVKVEGRSVPLGLVQAPARQFNYHGSNQAVWENLVSGTEKTLGVLKEKAEAMGTLDGQMAYQQGKTEQDILDAGGSKATQRGYLGMKAATATSEWAQQMKADIVRGDYNDMDPDQFRAHITEGFSALLTGNPTADRILTGMASKFTPDLAGTHVTAWMGANEQKSYNAYHDTLVQASTTNDSGVKELVHNPVFRNSSGLNHKRQLEAITDSVVSSYERSSPVLGTALGIGGTKQDRVAEGALLFEDFTPAQQSRMLKAREAYLTEKKNAITDEQQEKLRILGLSRAAGDISHDEFWEGVRAVGPGENVLKQQYQWSHGLDLQDIYNETAKMRGLSPDEFAIFMDFTEGDNLHVDDAAAAATSTMRELGYSEESQDKVLGAMYDAAGAKTANSAQEFSTGLSAEQEASIKEAAEEGFQAGGTGFQAAMQKVEVIVKGIPQAAKDKTMNDLYRQYGEKAGVDDSTSWSYKEQQDLIALKSAINRANVSKRNPGDVLASTEAELEVLAEKYNWSDRKRAQARGTLNMVTKGMVEHFNQQLIDTSVAQAKQQAKLNEARQLLASGALHTGSAEIQDIAHTLDRAAVVAKADEDFVKSDPSNTDPRARNFYRMEALGKRLEYWGDSSIDKDAQADMHGLANRPIAVQENGKWKVSDQYIGAYVMYRSLYDANPVLAAKYAGPAASIVLEKIRSLDETMTDTDSAIIMAFNDRDKLRPVPREELLPQFKSKEFNEATRAILEDEIEELLPSFIQKINPFSLAKAAPIHEDAARRALNDPGFYNLVQHQIQHIATEVAPGTPLPDVTRAAIRQVLANSTFIQGNLVQGSSRNGGNLLQDMGIKNEYSIGPMTGHSALVEWLNDHVTMDLALAQKFNPNANYRDYIDVGKIDWGTVPFHVGYDPDSGVMWVTPSGISDEGLPEYGYMIPVRVTDVGRTWTNKMQSLIGDKDKERSARIAKRAKAYETVMGI